MENPYMTIEKKYKKWQGIKYFCEKLYNDGYEFWQSKTHPSYSHFMKAKKK